MSPLFLTFGPSFRNNFPIDEVHLIDLYELMCSVLEIEPLKNDGNLKNIDSLLKSVIEKNIKSKHFRFHVIYL
jgi:hypothetical protein